MPSMSIRQICRNSIVCRIVWPIFLFLAQAVTLSAVGIHDIEMTELKYGYPTIHDTPVEDGRKLVTKWEIPANEDFRDVRRKILEQQEYDPSGRIIRSTWAPSTQKLASTPSMEDRATHFIWSYDLSGNLTSAERRTDGERPWIYRAEYRNNRITRWSSFSGSETEIEYDTEGRRTVEHMFRNGEPWGRRTWEYKGELKFSAEEIYFNENGTIREKASDEYFYDDNGRPVEVLYRRFRAATDSGELSYVRQIIYDDQGNTAEETLIDQFGITIDLIRRTYNSENLLTEEQIPVAQLRESWTGTIGYEYDAESRKISENRFNPVGDESGRTTWEYAEGITTRKNYSPVYRRDDDGNQIVSELRLTSSIIETFDESGTLLNKMLSREDGTIIRVSEYTYDSSGRLILTYERSSSGSFLYDYTYH